VNFFGHATVACMHSDEPRFVLGAMLPDLTSMAAIRVQRVGDEQLARGLDLHHATDRAFHACAPFLTLCESALLELERAGVSRAAARAVGHVGSELLLDGVLSSERAARAAYDRALEFALERRLERELHCRGDADADALRILLRRLRGAPIPEGYRDPDFVYERLDAILARRPRLSLRPQDREPVRGWLRAAAPLLERDAPAILELIMR